MAKSKEEIQFDKDLLKDVTDMMKIAATTYCKKAADELTKTAEYAISEFYNDYTPQSYKRTYNLKNNSYKRYYKNNGHMVYGGVYIGSEYMDTYYTWTEEGKEAIDPYIVAATSWESGLHGIYSEDQSWRTVEGVRGIVPIEIVNAKMTDKKFLKELENEAEKASRLKKYKYLNKFLDV